MKIWTITTDQDGEGTGTAVYFTAETANAKAVEIVTAWYERHLPGDTERRDHTNWRETYALLCDTTGFLDILAVAEHDISHHPAIIAVIQACDAAEEIMLRAAKDGVSLTPGERMDVYDAIADATCLLRGKMEPGGDEPAVGLSPNLQTELEKQDAEEHKQAEAYRAAAQRLHHREGEIEIDDTAAVSFGDDPGAYVQAWVWVSAFEATLGQWAHDQESEA